MQHEFIIHHKKIMSSMHLGATSIDKIGEVRLSDEIGGEEFETLKKTELYNYY